MVHFYLREPTDGLIISIKPAPINVFLYATFVYNLIRISSGLTFDFSLTTEL